MTRPLTPAGLRILDVASRLFYERGIRAVGVDLIAEEAGTTKKTLYDRFGSKDGLVIRYLERRFERWRDFVTERVDALPVDARPLGVLDALDEWMASQTRGCGFVNAFAEFGGSDHPAVDLVRAEKDWTRALYARLVAEAGYDGAESLGTRLALLHEGALVTSTAGGRSDGITVARSIAETIVAR